jgi:hypothetical protein
MMTANDEDPLGLGDWPDELDRDAVLPAMEAFIEVVGDTDDCELVITSDFENQVKARLAPALAEAFAQNRGDYGTAMAKTLRHDGRKVVVFDVRLFARGAPPPEATFRHEAFHVLLDRSGESVWDSYSLLVSQSDVFPDLVGMASIAAEEYRIQRAVYDRFPDDPWGSFEALCEAGHNKIHEAAVAYYWDPAKDVQPVMSSVMQAFSAMTTQAGYIAAQLEEANRATPKLGNADLHERMLGEEWHTVVAELRKLPPADQRVDREELERAILRIAARFEKWLEQMGFRAEVLDEGNTFFRVYEHEDWVRRGPVQSDDA